MILPLHNSILFLFIKIFEISHKPISSEICRMDCCLRSFLFIFTLFANKFTLYSVLLTDSISKKTAILLDENL